MELTPGQQLRQARELRGLSIAQAANETRIRVHYLEALETDSLDKLPSPAQGRGLLRSYAQYLQLDSDRLLQGLPAKESAPPPVDYDISPNTSVVNQAQAIFREIGDKLKRQRELIGLSLEDVERMTHLRMHFLKAIETGQIEDLPSSVQGRGMVSNYAVFLGFDPDPILLRFADGLQASLAARKGPRTSIPTTTSGPRRLRLFSSDIWFTALILIGLIAFVSWGILQVVDIGSRQQVQPTAPSVVEVLAPGEPSPAVSPTLASGDAGTPAAETPTSAPLQLEPTAVIEASPTISLDSLNQAPVQIYIAVRQRAWMRVTVDGKVTFEGRVTPGVAYVYSGNEQVAVLTGNGAALQLFYNRADLGLMGILGQVVERVFTPQGMVTPTPTPTPEGLPSPTPTAESTNTPAPTPTPTLRP